MPDPNEQELPAGGPGVEDPPINPDPETPEPAAPATAEQFTETNRLLKEIGDKLNKPGAEAPSADQVRALIKEKTGLSEAGIDWVMKLNRETAIAAVAPLAEKLAWSELRSTKANTPYPITKEIEDGMKEELKQYPEHMQGDSVLLEKVYLMELGKQGVAGKLAPKAAAPANPNPNPTPAPNPVVRRTIVSNNPNPAGGNGGGGGNTPPASKLNADEKEAARKMGVSEADYEKWKGTTIITPVGAK